MHCEHAHKTIVWSSVNSRGEPFEGSKQLRHQCDTCGKLLPNHLAHRFAKPDTPNINIAALEKYNQNQEREWQDKFRSFDEQREQERREWFEAHTEHLGTDEWQEKRVAVLERENGVCQGCREAPAEHVHHLSYAHWRDELLFELVALCKSCHERAHGRKF